MPDPRWGGGKKIKQLHRSRGRDKKIRNIVILRVSPNQMNVVKALPSQEQSGIGPVLSSAGAGVISNALDFEWLSTGWPASRHPRTVSKIISIEAEAV
jgi:hypothetical protein